MATARGRRGRATQRGRRRRAGRSGWGPGSGRTRCRSRHTPCWQSQRVTPVGVSIQPRSQRPHASDLARSRARTSSPRTGTAPGEALPASAVRPAVWVGGRTTWVPTGSKPPVRWPIWPVDSPAFGLLTRRFWPVAPPRLEAILACGYQVGGEDVGVRDSPVAGAQAVAATLDGDPATGRARCATPGSRSAPPAPPRRRSSPPTARPGRCPAGPGPRCAATPAAPTHRGPVTARAHAVASWLMSVPRPTGSLAGGDVVVAAVSR